MERLRAAIEQARKTRVSGDPGPRIPTEEQKPVVNGNGQVRAIANGHAPEVTDELPPRDPAADARWEALETIWLKPGRLRRHRLIVNESGPERAAYDMLRTRLLSVLQKEGWRRIAITSPTMACGKSTTALNLAISLSRLPELRTVVVETDLRRPSMANMLGHKGKDSFYDVLAGRAKIEDQLVRIGDNVAVALNYGPVRNPAELLHGRNTPSVLDSIEETFQPDIVFFDTPPMMQSDDTLGFIKHVDCAMLIALAEQTTLDQVDFCESELSAHTNVAGVVLNRCRYNGGMYGYGYGDY